MWNIWRRRSNSLGFDWEVSINGLGSSSYEIILFHGVFTRIAPLPLVECPTAAGCFVVGIHDLETGCASVA